MESTDREILIEINGRIMSLEAEQRRQKEELASLRQEVKAVHDEQLLLHVKLDTLSTFMSLDIRRNRNIHSSCNLAVNA